MAPAAYRKGGTGETIRFAVGPCSLGAILVAATARGVCAILLGDDPDALLRGLAADIAAGRTVGLLTHHLAHDAAIWRFVEDLLSLLLGHPAVQPLDFRRLCEPVAVDSGAPPSNSPVSEIARSA